MAMNDPQLRWRDYIANEINGDYLADSDVIEDIDEDETELN